MGLVLQRLGLYSVTLMTLGIAACSYSVVSCTGVGLTYASFSELVTATAIALFQSCAP